MNAGTGSLAAVAADRMNVESAAAYLGLSASTLNQYRSGGRGPRYMRIGRRVMYRRQDLDQYIEAGIVETSDSRAAA